MASKSVLKRGITAWDASMTSNLERFLEIFDRAVKYPEQTGAYFNSTLSQLEICFTSAPISVIALHEAWCLWNTLPLDGDGILQGVANDLVLTMSQFTLSKMECAFVTGACTLTGTEISPLFAATTDSATVAVTDSTAIVMKDSFNRAHCSLVKSAPNRAVESMPIWHNKLNVATIQPPMNMTNRQCSRRRWLLLDVAFFRKGVGTGGVNFGY
ncbi:hypothetical protein B0H17DRAFT_1152727 [Mycena rosella]|uniref:Uncharacterized protein n=1 Tax=Mycena rosella TaxID=1033263 RepID=A0AAD7BBP5_MYCRO|nr:hypothetical protein B0H17DRAFT_1152727 [Mycena rosella]